MDCSGVSMFWPCPVEWWKYVCGPWLRLLTLVFDRLSQRSG
jgi:hypothetical protein